MTVPAAEPSFHVAHLNLACRDWRRSLDFYARVLGARYLFHLGPTKVVTDVAGFELFLEQVPDPAVDPRFHFGLRTTAAGVHAFADRLARLGVPMVRGNNPAPGPMTGPDGVRVALYFEDPDGWLVEVYSPEQRVLDSGLLAADPRWDRAG